jgi:hypothetical protein
MATLGATFAIPLAFRGGNGAKKDNTPPINAGSKDEEKFIQYERATDQSGTELTIGQGVPTTG